MFVYLCDLLLCFAFLLVCLFACLFACLFVCLFCFVCLLVCLVCLFKVIVGPTAETCSLFREEGLSH